MKISKQSRRDAKQLFRSCATDGLLDGSEVVKKIRAAVSRQHEIRLAEVILLRPTGLPRTTSGKVQRRLCRELFLANRLKKW